MMDLGASICTPRTPSCLVCVLRGHCAAFARGLADVLPAKAKKDDKPQRYGAAFLAVRDDGAVLLRRRPPKGLLGGMLEVPSTPWGPIMPGSDEALGFAPLRADWRRTTGIVRHSFTHFHLELEVYRAELAEQAPPPEGAVWYPRASLPEEAIPSVMRKVLVQALKGR
jgi:A/G-specific adenine glycosylase